MRVFRRRVRACDPSVAQHTGPFEATAIPSLGRCRACGCVTGLDDDVTVDPYPYPCPVTDGRTARRRRAGSR